MKEWVVIHKIKALHDEGKGLGVRAIGRQLHISRNTVKKYLSMDEEAIQTQQENRERQKLLDEHREYIIHLLHNFPKLSAVKILRKLREKAPDLDCSDRTARRYVGRLKESVTLKQKRYYEPVLDMVPGVQCQVDGGELARVWVGGQETVIYFVVFVLSYSRLMYVGCSREPVDTESFIQMHDAAFRHFGGRPEECVYDQTKLVVLHEQYRELELNQRFHAYATAAGFRIHACEGYDPESKGKVEAGVKYVKYDGLYGETFEDWLEVKTHLFSWLQETANVRVHGATGEKPRDRYERDERAHMGSYLSPKYLIQTQMPQQTRKVDKTGLISWKANKYSAPMAYQQTRVGVEEEEVHLVLSDLENGQTVARHRLSKDKGVIVKNTDHYRDKEQKIVELEDAVIKKLGEKGGGIFCTLLKRTSPRIYKDQLVGLKTLLERFDMPPAVLARLCERSQLTTLQIRDYLEAHLAHPERLEKISPETKDDGCIPDHSALIRYADITQPRQEVDHELVH